jgi:VanZ family protein
MGETLMPRYKATMPRRSIPFWIVLLLYWCTIAYFTHMPAPEFRLPGQDKTAHYLAYGALGGLMYLALWTNNPLTRDLAFKILVIGMCYGALDEWTQALPWFKRNCDFLDWCADVAGLSTAIVGMTLIRRGLELFVFRAPPAATSAP